MAIIFPVYQRVRNVTLTAHDFTATEPTALAGLDLGAATSPLTSGLLYGISVTLQANTGNAASDYVVDLFSEDSATLTSGTSSELYSATFSFAAVGSTVSDMLTQPIPLLEQPFIQVSQSTTNLDSNTLLIKFYVQSIAGN